MVQETSLRAYHEEVVPTIGKRQEAVLDQIRRHENLTNSEIARNLGWPINTVTPRTNELVDLGLVREDCKRTCSVTKRNVIAWATVRNTLF